MWHDKLTPEMESVLRAVRKVAGDCLDAPEMALFQPLLGSLSPDALLAVGTQHAIPGPIVCVCHPRHALQPAGARSEPGWDRCVQSLHLKTRCYRVLSAVVSQQDACWRHSWWQEHKKCEDKIISLS